VPTVGAFSPRLVEGGMVYVALKNDGHSIWRFSNGTANELWSAAQTRVVGWPSISPDGQWVAFSAERAGKTKLYLLNAQRASSRVLADAFEIRGAPAWSRDGKSIIVATNQGGEPQLHQVPIDGQPPTAFLRSYSLNPVLSTTGPYLIYAEADAGPDFTLRAATLLGAPHPLPDIKLPRGARRVSFVPGRNALIVLLGQMRHNNFWYVDLDSGERRQLTNFTREFTVRDFDVSPDGKEIVFDRRQENSDVALIELPRP
jgi:Tol biopolymer transport system component